MRLTPAILLVISASSQLANAYGQSAMHHAGRDAFLSFTAENGHELSAKLRSHPSELKFLSRHFHMTPEALCTVIDSKFRLETIASAESVNVWGLSKAGFEYSVPAVLRQGERVWSMNGHEILRWSCGNPLVSDLSGGSVSHRLMKRKGGRLAMGRRRSQGFGDRTRTVVAGEGATRQIEETVPSDAGVLKKQMMQQYAKEKGRLHYDKYNAQSYANLNFGAMHVASASRFLLTTGAQNPRLVTSFLKIAGVSGPVLKPSLAFCASGVFYSAVDAYLLRNGKKPDVSMIPDYSPPAYYQEETLLRNAGPVNSDFVPRSPRCADMVLHARKEGGHYYFQESSLSTDFSSVDMGWVAVYRIFDHSQSIPNGSSDADLTPDHVGLTVKGHQNLLYTLEFNTTSEETANHGAKRSVSRKVRVLYRKNKLQPWYLVNQYSAKTGAPTRAYGVLLGFIQPYALNTNDVQPFRK